MPSPTTAEVRSQIDHLERTVNEWEIIPATGYYRSSVLLALLSKSLIVSKAICSLVDAGFEAEAFGMTRTLIEIFFCVRYICNKDTEERAGTYVKYGARVRQEWQTIILKYYPNTPPEALKLDSDVLDTAKEFKSKAHWTGHGGQAKLMAMEADSGELDDQGEPIKDSFDYDVLYFWTSQFVHVTVEALGAHALPPGEVFSVHARHRNDRDWTRFSLVNVVTMLSKIYVRACRTMNIDQPQSLTELFAFISSLVGSEKPKLPAS
jgi:hypothetical protein